jgi:hypothetical protein
VFTFASCPAVGSALASGEKASVAQAIPTPDSPVTLRMKRTQSPLTAAEKAIGVIDLVWFMTTSQSWPFASYAGDEPGGGTS